MTGSPYCLCLIVRIHHCIIYISNVKCNKSHLLYGSITPTITTNMSTTVQQVRLIFKITGSFFVAKVVETTIFNKTNVHCSGLKNMLP